MLDPIDKARVLLQRPVDKRNLAWARLVCELGRDLHLGVWEGSFTNDLVEGEILKIFEASRKAFAHLYRTARRVSTREELQAFGGNALFRQRNIAENYLQGRSCQLVTESQLQEIRALAFR